MPTDYGVIRQGIANNLAGLNAGESWITISAYMLANPSPPHIQVMPGEIQYDLTGSRGGDVVLMTIQAFVVANFDINAQKKFDQMLANGGPLSVKALVESDRRLGGVVDDLRIVTHTGYNVYNLASRGPVLGGDWQVEIVTSTV